MKIDELVDDKVVLILNNNLRLEGTVKAVDEAGIGFVTSQKSSYIPFTDILKIKTIPYLEEVDF